MGKATPAASKQAATSLSSTIKQVASRLQLFLEQDLVSPAATRSHPGLVEHYTFSSKVSGSDSIVAYADEIAQAAFFHFLCTRSNGADPCHAGFMPGLDGVLEDLFADPDLQAEIGRYALDQFTDAFHEQFLKSHDPGKKKARGVFYTPAPVVSFIVRGVDTLLKTDLGIDGGVANDGVTIIDPACGTGAFLKEIYTQVLNNPRAGAKPHLLGNVVGHDISLSALVFCEMQLARLLATASIDAGTGDIVGLHHVNSLAQPSEKTSSNLFNKENVPPRIVVMIGNPPYAVSSANKHAFISDLMVDYKTGLKERNIQPLSDDYVKFIRYAQWQVQQASRGIVAFVTNNAFIYKMIYRKMREHLLSTFDDIYIINLHGNANIGEKTPAGDPDDNIFDIRVGTCIVFMVKSGAGAGHRVHHHEVYGTREAKMAFLEQHGLAAVPFELVQPVTPGFFFIKKDMLQEHEYEQHASIKDIFMYYTIGVKTHRDDFIVELDHDVLVKKMADLASPMLDADVQAKYALNDSIPAIHDIRAKVRAEGVKSTSFLTYLYRPFDHRVLYFSPSVITRHRLRVMKHMLEENVALATTRLLSTGVFNHCLVTPRVGDIGLLSSRTSESAYFFPLYLHADLGNKTSNIKPQFMVVLGRMYPGAPITPEDVLWYVYAILHAPWYRRTYGECLKNDFPRIPLPRGIDTFMRVARAGSKLARLHVSWTARERRAEQGASTLAIEKIHHDAHACRVLINETQAIENISPAAWDFKIGNYPVLHKWLRGRKGRALSPDEVSTFQRISWAIDETIEIMEQLDTDPNLDPREGKR